MLPRWIRTITSKGLAQEFAYVALPKVCGGVGTILINLLLVHQLETASFGIYSLCIASILLFDAILGTAIDTGVLKLAPKLSTSDPEAALGLERSAIIIKLTTAGLVSVLLLLLSGPISQAIFQQPDLHGILALSCLSGCGLLLLRSVQLHLQLKKRFKQYGLLDFANHLLRFSSVGVIVAFSEPSPAKILAVWATVPFVVSIIGLTWCGRKLLKQYALNWHFLLELLRFVKWSLLTFSLTSLASRADQFLIGLLAGVEEVGIFAAGYLFTVIPELLGMYLAVLFGPRITPAIESNTISSLLSQTQKLLGALALIALLGGWLAIATVGRWILPDEYSSSLIVVAILLPGALAAMVNFPLVNNYVMFVSPKALVRIEMMTLPFALVLYFVAIPSYGAIGAAAVSSSFRTAKAIYTLRLSQRLAKSNVQPLPENSSHLKMHTT